MINRHELLTVHEVARVLRCSPRSVRRWLAAGRLPSVQVAGGPRLVPATTLLHLIHQASRVGATTPTPRADDLGSIENKEGIMPRRKYHSLPDELVIENLATGEEIVYERVEDDEEDGSEYEINPDDGYDE